MIVNYDKENGFTTFFSRFGKGNNVSADFIDAWSRIGRMTNNQPASWQAWGEKIGYTDKSLLSFFKNVDQNKSNISDLGTIVNSATKSTSKFASVIDTGKGILGGFASAISNMFIGMAAGMVVTGVVSAIDDYIHRNERLIEAGEEAKSSIESTFSEFSDSKSSIDSLGKSLSDNADNIKTTGDAIDSIAEKYMYKANTILKMG